MKSQSKEEKIPATQEGLLSLRKSLGLAQREMAERLGMSLRNYQDVEGGATSYRTLHRLAAERVMLAEAANRGQPDLMPKALHADVLSAALLLPILQKSHSPKFWVENKDRFLRQLIIREIEAQTGRPLCVYFASAEISSLITQDDVGRLYEIISPYRGGCFDLLLETKGGGTDAVEGLISMLRSMSSDFRVIVPSRAKSNGTLIGLAASEIIMGVTSELGPMEPAVAGIPSNILASEEYKKIGFSMHQFAHYAIQQTRKLASTLLKTGMLKHRSESEVQHVLDKLITREHYPSSGSVINHEAAKQLGLKISYLEDNSSLWKKIWLLYCMYVFDSNARELSKIFEQRTFSHAILGPDPLDEEASSSK